MRIGDLRHRIELQATLSVADGMGGTTDTWTTQDAVWAAIWPVSATEQIRAASPTMVGTHRIRIRYHEDLRPAWRVKFGNRYFSIVSIVDPNEKHEMQELLCREVVG